MIDSFRETIWPHLVYRIEKNNKDSSNYSIWGLKSRICAYTMMEIKILIFSETSTHLFLMPFDVFFFFVLISFNFYCPHSERFNLSIFKNAQVFGTHCNSCVSKIDILISDVEHLQTKFICMIMTHNHKECEVICLCYNRRQFLLLVITKRGNGAPLFDK